MEKSKETLLITNTIKRRRHNGIENKDILISFSRVTNDCHGYYLIIRNVRTFPKYQTNVIRVLKNEL